MARGPAYPYVGLQQAVELSQKMYAYAKRSPIRADAVVREAWEYSPTSSSGQKVLAALRYFGLVEDVAVGESKQIKLTDRAYRILIDSPDSPDRKKALKEAALAPKSYAYCWKKWEGETPPSMRSHLIFDHGFNEGSVDGFLRDYKETIRYAGLSLDEAGSSMAEDENSQDSQTADNGTDIKSSLTDKAGANSSQQVEVKGGPKMWNEVFNLPEGPVTIQMPASISADSLEDLSAGLELFMRKLGRMVAKAEAELPKTVTHSEA